MSAAVRAQGRTMIVTLDHGKVTLAPRWWYRLRHPTIVTRHFYAFEAALVWSPPGLLRLGGQLFFDLSDAYGVDLSSEEDYLVTYGRASKSDFIRLVKTGRWLEVVTP